MNRNLALDGLRGVAVLLVVLHHLAGLGFGYFGVDVFFALSGYLLGGQLLDASRSFSCTTARAYYAPFFVRRAFRILPLYAVLIASYYLVAPAHLIGSEARWSYPLFLQNLLPNSVEGCGLWMIATWSLAVEEHFYLLLPWTVRRVPRHAIPLLCIAAGIFALVWRQWGAAVGSLNMAYAATPARIDGLAAGVLVAWAQRERRLPSTRVLGFLAAGALAPLLVGGAGVVRQASTYTLASVGCGALVALLLTAKTRSAALESSLMRWIGARSFAIYLWHLPMYGLAKMLIPVDEDGPSHSLPTVAAALVATLVLAEASWWLLERPMQKLGRRIAKRFEARSAFDALQAEVVAANASVFARLSAVGARTYAALSPACVPGLRVWIRAEDVRPTIEE